MKTLLASPGSEPNSKLAATSADSWTIGPTNLALASRLIEMNVCVSASPRQMCRAEMQPRAVVPFSECRLCARPARQLARAILLMLQLARTAQTLAHIDYAHART